MERIQFYPSTALSDTLKKEAEKSGVSVSQFVTDLLEQYYGLSNRTYLTITQLTANVLREVEDYIKKANGPTQFSLFTASSTFRNIDMTASNKPRAVRASIGRSFERRIGKMPFDNVRKYIVNGKQQFSENHALMYETYEKENLEIE